MLLITCAAELYVV